MADAWARLTGEVGVALATGGPGHANAVPALYTALASESPVVLLSGHSPLDEMGRGAFQEMRQVDLAAPLAKAAWASPSVSSLGADIARAMRIAASGRPGPVHLSLPSDALDAAAAGRNAARARCVRRAGRGACARGGGVGARRARPRRAPGDPRGARRSCAAPAAKRAKRLEAAVRVPVVGMESPRGLSEPALGALAEMLPQADLIVLLGKTLDFALKFGRPPAIAPALPVRARRSRSGAPRTLVASARRASRVLRRRGLGCRRGSARRAGTRSGRGRRAAGSMKSAQPRIAIGRRRGRRSRRPGTARCIRSKCAARCSASSTGTRTRC